MAQVAWAVQGETPRDFVDQWHSGISKGGRENQAACVPAGGR